jgi:hypothetical protein
MKSRYLVLYLLLNQNTAVIFKVGACLLELQNTFLNVPLYVCMCMCLSVP